MVITYIAPDDTPDPRKYTDAVLEEYNNWCNGECFGVCVWEYVNVGTDEESEWELQNRDNEVWGFIGQEYAEKELEERMEALERWEVIANEKDNLRTMQRRKIPAQKRF